MNKMNVRESLQWDFNSICTRELQEALQAPELKCFDASPWDVPKLARRAAYQLALALGKCRILGVPLPKGFNQVLPQPIAAAAAEELAERAQELTRSAETLQERWENAELPEQADFYVINLFEGLMETYAVMQAISQTYEAALEQGDDAAQFFTSYDRAGDALASLDRTVFKQETLEVLSEVVSLPVYRNWKDSLAEPYRSAPPWWLSGTLEKIAAQIDRESNRAVLEFRQKVARLEQKLRTKATAAGVSAHYWPRDREWPVPMAAALAASTPSLEPPVQEIYWWQSPDGKYLARLSIPSRSFSSGVMPLELLDQSGNLSAQWAGQPVKLNNVEAIVDHRGVALLPIDKVGETLPAVDYRLELEVGSSSQRWDPIEPPDPKVG